MTSRPRSVRTILAAALVLGLAAVGLGAASPASANTGFPSSSPVTPLAGHEIDTGGIVLEFDPAEAGLTVAVTTPDPADSTAVSTVTGEIGADGSVTLRDFAGPTAVYLRSADGQVHERGGAPLPGTFAHRQAASIYRGVTSTYTYQSSDDTFQYHFDSNVAPKPPATSADVLAQIPTTHFTVSADPQGPGDTTLLSFTDVSPNGVGNPGYTDDLRSYAYDAPEGAYYGAPEAVGGTPLRNGRYLIQVPGKFSYGRHVVASFDKYGRLATVTSVGDASLPKAPDGSSAAAHPLDTGTLLLQLDGYPFGTLVTSTVADPTAPGTSSVVSATATPGGLVALVNFAGYVRIDIGGPSGDDNQNPATFRADVNIYRGQTVLYGYPSVSNTSSNPFGLLGPIPAPAIPATAAEAEQLTPIATSTVSPTTWDAGADLPLAVTDVAPTSIIPNDSFTVANYVYGAPESLGSSTIYLMQLEGGTGYSYSFTVPGQYTSGGTVAASFDQFGRLVTLDRLDQSSVPPTSTPTPGPTVPSTDPAVPTPGATPGASALPGTPSETPDAAGQTATGLANTGRSDLAPAGIAAGLLFGTGLAGLIVASRRRRASRTRH
ncbi:hypothetical protein B7R21_16105 [Subtercola boreus]|uniref:Gram-positive cocci surface proteins LPxTG domain-containing protein n=1 Tax=Subtercola boreus TaxID=120213 RepID=A0A3E0VCR5_9MICO|nr:hypothetical protein [Subtercola boreus]RFA07686.1 hypothetical protein B7R21_16105 [Subtercola boreus]